LIRCLSTLLIPDSGTAKVLGYDIIKDEMKVKENIGILFGAQSGLYPKLTCYENLFYFATLYGIEPSLRKNRIFELLELVQLRNESNTLVEKLSTGMKQKLSLARVLLKEPKVLFLDEPTIGLDPHISKIIRQFIKDELAQKRKMTILLTTHYMYEAEFLCDRVAFINEGKISTPDKVANIISSLPYNQTLIIYPKGYKNALDLSSLLKKNEIFSSFNTQITEKDGRRIVIIKGKNIDFYLQKILETLNIEVEKVELKNPSLEDAFIFYTGATIENFGGDVRI
jgi:ABC-2 type transport system ATP-binding protein